MQAARVGVAGAERVCVTVQPRAAAAQRGGLQRGQGVRQVAAWRLGQGRISAPSEASRDVKFTPCILSNIARNYVNVAATCTTKMFLSEVHSYSIIFMVHFSHTQSIVDDNCKMLVSVCIMNMYITQLQLSLARCCRSVLSGVWPRTAHASSSLRRRQRRTAAGRQVPAPAAAACGRGVRHGLVRQDLVLHRVDC